MNARVAVIGAVGSSVTMEVERFHTGGETVFAKSAHREFGGKGFNRTVASARQGVKTAFLAACGAEDEAAIAALLRAEGVDARLVARTNEESDFAAIITDATGTTHVTVYPGARLEPDDVTRLFAETIAAADVLVLDNEVPQAVNDRAAAIAAANGTRIILNPAPYRPLPEAFKAQVAIFTPNEFETEGLDGVSGEVVETLGARGCRIRSTDGRIPAADCGPAVDSTGAGDTFNGVLAARLAEGEALAAACRAANAAAGIEVTRRYVLPAIPFRNEIRDLEP